MCSPFAGCGGGGGPAYGPGTLFVLLFMLLCVVLGIEFGGEGGIAPGRIASVCGGPPFVMVDEAIVLISKYL